MDFIISSNKIKKGENAIILDSNTLNGIKKIAAKVALDLKAVFGTEPEVFENKTVKNEIKIEKAKSAPKHKNESNSPQLNLFGELL